MKHKPGYRLDAAYIADVTGATRVGHGWSFSAKALAERYERMGLEVEMSGSPDLGLRVRAATCRICGTFDKTSIRGSRKHNHYVSCDPDLHRAYYDAIESK